jgi:hypothetical protein
MTLEIRVLTLDSHKQLGWIKHDNENPVTFLIIGPQRLYIAMEN